MLVRESLVVFFILVSLIYTSTPDSTDLEKRVTRLLLEENNLMDLRQAHDTKGMSEPFLSFEEIIEQGDALRASTLADDTRTIVKKIDAKLSEFLDLGVPPLDAISIINSFFINVEELVLAAVKEKAYTLLKLLQIIYIWRDEAQFHWFQALSYLSPWYDKIMWNTHPMDWKRNLWTICEWDNDVLMMAIQSEILSRNALNSFNENLLALCVKYDAIKVFEIIWMEPIRLEEHIELMSVQSSAKLLHLYQTITKTEHLHLERFSFPEKLPANVKDFEFLMSHGHNCFSMSRFIKIFCMEGRLDLLKYLYELNARLVPDQGDLQSAAERGRVDILDWAHQLKLLEVADFNNFVIPLAINCHLQALDHWISLNKITITNQTIEAIIEAGALEALEWIDQRHALKQAQKSWANAAAKQCHLSILIWLYKRFRILPCVIFLRNATIEMLEWVKVTDETLINSDLVQFGVVGNFELLRWVYENAPLTIFESNKCFLSENVLGKEMMLWLHEKLNVCSLNVDWAYKIGDLETVKWAMEQYHILPTPENARIAVRKDHFHITEWIYGEHSEHLNTPEMLKDAVEYGSLRVAEYLLLKFKPKEKPYVRINTDICTDRRLAVLKWVYKHSFDMSLSHETSLAASRGDLQIVLWLSETFPNILPSLVGWTDSVNHGHFEVYKWFLERYPEERQWEELSMDIKMAYSLGHLEIVKLILDKEPLLASQLLRRVTKKTNYHVKQWLVTNGKWINS